MLNPALSAVRRRSAAVLVAFWMFAAPLAPLAADITPNAAMLRFPDVSAEHIVFVYANDLWIAPRDGGMAAPLASPPGSESLPRFSPDGKTIAFVGNYDGNRDIYTIPISGGVPTRVTHHPASEAIAAWTPDGRIVFGSNGLAGLSRQSQLFITSAEGGMREQVPVPYAGFGTISPDGQWLAYTLHSTDTRTWKRYRGGMATDVWLFNLSTKQSRRVTDWEGTDTLPMWLPGDNSALYYLSDDGPEHRLNVWSFNVATGTKKQVTKFADDDVRWPSSGPATAGAAGGSIVFQLGSKLMRLDLPGGETREIKVTIPGDRPRIRPRTVNASSLISNGTISPTGRRVVLEARGELWSLPAKDGVTRNMTRTDGFAERDPSWSPDGKWIAYFSDESGEYELYIRPSDSRPAAEEKKDEVAPLPGPWSDAPPRRLTSLGEGFRYSATWSPDSKFIAFHDQNGRMYLTTVETGETREFDKDPWMSGPSFSWSHDSQWITYARADSDNANGCVMIYNVKTGEKTQVTSSMFDAGSPTFDRKGDWLFYTSRKDISRPRYSDIDNTFVYADSGVLLMVPLRAEVKSPWLPRSDEESLKKEEAKKDDKKDEKKEDGDKGGAADDGVSGTWEATAIGPTMPPGGLVFTMKLKLGADGRVTGTISSAMGAGSGEGTFKKDSGAFEFTATVNGAAVTLRGEIKGTEGKGTWSVEDQQGDWTARRTAADSPPAAEEKKDDAKPDAKKQDKSKDLKIDLEGFEARAIQIPLPSGNFGGLMVSDGDRLIFARTGGRGGRGRGDTGIKIYNTKTTRRKRNSSLRWFVLDVGRREETAGDARPGRDDRGRRGGRREGATPSTAGMMMTIEPRNEWRQIFNEAWRLQRDFFYESTLHGVDWPKMREHYGAMIDDCASREDVAWVLGELISELNIGHAYIQGVGDGESQPSQNVGLLGCDFEIDRSGAQPAYRITKIQRGGPWDSDAVGPLSQPGVDVKEGDYLLEVNGVAVDTGKDPWAAFIGLAGRPTYLTVSSKPTLDKDARLALVTPMGSEVGLRFRAWIESKRRYVEERTGGKVGYVYVPNTGVDGQSELYRQFFGQKQKQAMIIDERWNGGGQIPHRFVELLNRPVTNFWARRDGNAWPSPDNGHQGPKCMLINGLAGSGGDMFPGCSATTTSANSLARAGAGWWASRAIRGSSTEGR